MDWTQERYPSVKGIKVSDTELKAISVKKHEFHGEWNYDVGKSDIRQDIFLHTSSLLLYPESRNLPENA